MIVITVGMDAELWQELQRRILVKWSPVLTVHAKEAERKLHPLCWHLQLCCSAAFLHRERNNHAGEETEGRGNKRARRGVVKGAREYRAARLKRWGENINGGDGRGREDGCEQGECRYNEDRLKIERDRIIMEECGEKRQLGSAMKAALLVRTYSYDFHVCFRVLWKEAVRMNCIY